MKQSKSLFTPMAVAALAACGGGGTTPDAATPSAPAPAPLAAQAPVTTVPDAIYSVADKVGVFNVLNDYRSLCGFGKLAQETNLDAAAQAHATYLSANGTLGHVETPGNPSYYAQSLADRFIKAGYTASTGGEVAAVTIYGSYFTGQPAAAPGQMPTPPDYELSASNTLRQLISSVYHLAALMRSDIDIGVGVATSTSPMNIAGKTLVVNTGLKSSALAQSITPDKVLTFPCQGVTNVMPQFGPEDPNPLPSNTERGQPVYVASGEGTTIQLTFASIAPVGGSDLPVQILTASNDPHQRIRTNQAFVVPTKHLADNTTYRVTLQGTSTGLVSGSNPAGSFNNTFTFQTGTFYTQ